jgi:hypothetical protein
MDPNWGVFANRPPSPFGGNLTDDGTLTGNKNMANDYSITPQEFWFEVPSGFNFDMHAVFIRYCMSAVPRKEDYADIDGGLDNGLLFTATRNGVTTALGPPILNNAEWAFAATRNSHANFEPGVLEDVWTFSIDIEQVFGTHDRFYGAQNDRYSCTVSDDLSDIYCHEIYVYGTVTKYVL